MKRKSILLSLIFVGSIFSHYTQAMDSGDPETSNLQHTQAMNSRDSESDNERCLELERMALFLCRPGERFMYSFLNVAKLGLNVALIEMLNSVQSSDIMDTDADKGEVDGAFTATRAVAWVDFGLSIFQLGGQVLSLVRGEESEAPVKIQMAGTACSVIPWLVKLIALNVAKASFNDSSKAKLAWAGVFSVGFFSDPDLAALAAYVYAKGS